MAEIFKKNVTWSPNESIYEVGSNPNGVFIIMSGSVNIYSKDGLLLNTIWDKELLGETSTILATKRSVSAKAGPVGASAVHISKTKLKSQLKKNKTLAIIIEKTQLRLLASNRQSEELSNLMGFILEKIKKGDQTVSDLTSLIDKTKSKIQTLINSNLD